MPQVSATHLSFSFVMPMGVSLQSSGLMGVVYFLLLCYMFVGIAIVSDIFMESIETITAVTVIKTYVDN